MSVALVAAVVLGGLVVWPASPAAAQEVHSYQTNCFQGGVFETQLVFEISAVGPDEPVAAGEPFVLSDLTVTIRGASDWEWAEFDELVVLGGQVLDLGRFEQPTPAPPTDDSWVRPNWGPMDVELIAPDEGGVHGIGPESARITTRGLFVSGVNVCPNFGEVEPFATVEVVAEPAPDPEPEPETPGAPGVDERERGSVDEDDAARVVRTEVRRVRPAVAQPAFTG